MLLPSDKTQSVRDIARGQVWELAQAWHGDRLSPDFRGRSVEQAVAIFEGLGLRSAFWRTGG